MAARSRTTVCITIPIQKLFHALPLLLWNQWAQPRTNPFWAKTKRIRQPQQKVTSTWKRHLTDAQSQHHEIPILGNVWTMAFPGLPNILLLSPPAPATLRCPLPNMAITCSHKHGLQECHIFFQAHCTVYTKVPEEIPEVIKAYETLQAAPGSIELHKIWLQIWCVSQLKFTWDGLATLWTWMGASGGVSDSYSASMITCYDYLGQAMLSVVEITFSTLVIGLKAIVLSTLFPYLSITWFSFLTWFL